MKTKIEYTKPTALIEVGENCEQNLIVLRIDWDSKEITVRTIAPDQRYNISVRVWYGLATECYLTPELDATKLKDWVESEIVPLTEKLLPMFSVDWNGSNWCGNWGRNGNGFFNAYSILQEIEEKCADYTEVPQLQEI